MGNDTLVLGSTRIAATSWVIDGSAHLRVYTQNSDFGIRESRWDHGWSGGTMAGVVGPWLEWWDHGWSGGTPADAIVQTAFGSGLAALNFDDRKKIRVYYTWYDYGLSKEFLGEMCQDNGGQWYHGGLTKKCIEVESGSPLAACAQALGDRIVTVVYHRRDGKLGEAVWGANGWTQSTILGDNIKVSYRGGIAVVASPRPPGNVLHAYYVGNDNKISQICTDLGGTWCASDAGSLELEAVHYGPSLSAYDNQDSIWPPDTSVVYTGRTGLQEATWKDFEWVKNNALAGYRSPGGLAMVRAHTVDSLRLYVQDPSTLQVQELVREKGDTAWRNNSIVPTGRSE